MLEFSTLSGGSPDLVFWQPDNRFMGDVRAFLLALGAGEADKKVIFLQLRDSFCCDVFSKYVTPHVEPSQFRYVVSSLAGYENLHVLKARNNRITVYTRSQCIEKLSAILLAELVPATTTTRIMVSGAKQT